MENCGAKRRDRKTFPTSDKLVSGAYGQSLERCQAKDKQG